MIFSPQIDVHLEEASTDASIKSVESVIASATKETSKKRRSESATRVPKSVGVDQVEESAAEVSPDKASPVQLSAETVKKIGKSKAANVAHLSGVSFFYPLFFPFNALNFATQMALPGLFIEISFRSNKSISLAFP